MTTTRINPNPATPRTRTTFRLAENPLWDPDRRTLFITDIEAGELWALPSDSDEPTRIYTGPKVGGFTLEHTGRLILFRESDIAAFDPSTADLTHLADFHAPDTLRFNDVNALPNTTALAGTIANTDGAARLYHVTAATGAPELRELPGTATNVSNGIAIAPDHTHLHWTDTTHHAINRYRLDADGAPAERTLAIDTSEEHAGFPDGLCTDEHANLYSARWAGARVRVYDANTKHLADIPVPDADNITSACFGGPDLTTLFITTAGGPIYTATPGTRGLAELRTRLA